MRQSLQESIAAQDIKDIVEALKKRAKKGNLAAAKAVLDLCGATGKGPATVYNVQVNCDARLRTIVGLRPRRVIPDA